MKLNIILFAILIILSTVRVFASASSEAELGLTFEQDTMTEEQLDQELDELVDIKAIEDVKHFPNEMAE